jgi:hypothetical protein
MAYIKLNDIEVTTETQVRERICQATVDEYAQAIEEGAIFPPIELVEDGILYFIADGYHRYEAAKKIGKEAIEANVRQGSVRDAILIGLSANHNHGLRLTINDRKKMVRLLLEDEEWRNWSNVEIAKKCSASHVMVAKIRSDFDLNKDITIMKRNGKTMVRRAAVKKELPNDYSLKNAVIEEEQTNKKDIEIEELCDVVEMLKAENITLSDKLAVVAIEGGQDVKALAEKTIQDLRGEVSRLHIQLASVKQSRDSYQSEKASMLKQLNWYVNQRKKCTCKAKDKLEQAA